MYDICTDYINKQNTLQVKQGVNIKEVDTLKSTNGIILLVNKKDIDKVEYINELDKILFSLDSLDKVIGYK